MGVTFAEFLEKQPVVRSRKTGALLKVERVVSPRDIECRVVLPGDDRNKAPGLSKFVEHLDLLELDLNSSKGNAYWKIHGHGGGGKNMAKEEDCGTCCWHKKEGGGWVCNNPESELYADWTDYNDSCEEYEERTPYGARRGGK